MDKEGGVNFDGRYMCIVPYKHFYLVLQFMEKAIEIINGTLKWDLMKRSIQKVEIIK